MPQVQLLAQVHDAIYFQAREELDPQEIHREVKKLMVTELTAPNGRKFSVPTDAKIGYNWGHYIPANPEKNLPERNSKGLRKFSVKH
jgi:DNA polymerase I-like protein with 3'-5' exonuclease and polymerase domains